MDTAGGHMKLSNKAVMPIYINHDALDTSTSTYNAVDDTGLKYVCYCEENTFVICQHISFLNCNLLIYYT